MRLLIWILGVFNVLAALMESYRVAPSWVWVWYVFLGLWFVAGLAVVIAAFVRAAVAKAPRSAPSALVPRSVPPQKAQGGE